MITLTFITTINNYASKFANYSPFTLVNESKRSDITKIRNKVNVKNKLKAKFKILFDHTIRQGAEKNKKLHRKQSGVRLQSFMSSVHYLGVTTLGSLWLKTSYLM